MSTADKLRKLADEIEKNNDGKVEPTLEGIAKALEELMRKPAPVVIQPYIPYQPIPQRPWYEPSITWEHRPYERFYGPAWQYEVTCNS